MLELLLLAGAALAATDSKPAPVATGGAHPPNPPPLPGTRVWTKAVSPEMTKWAQSILYDPAGHPMGSVDQRSFPPDVIARVEWHDWTYRNGVKVTGTFRGVTLYEVIS
jgi:hypothetical protein